MCVVEGGGGGDDDHPDVGHAVVQRGLARGGGRAHRPAASEAPEGAAAAAVALKPRERSSPRPAAAAAAEEATQSAKAPVSDGKRRPEATLISADFAAANDKNTA